MDMEFEDILAGHGLRSGKEEDQGAGIKDSFAGLLWSVWVDQLAQGSDARTWKRPARAKPAVYLRIKY